jgi:hypothetical protein
MMLLLTWRTLALAAAPLVTPLGLVVMTTSSPGGSSSSRESDAVVAALALRTAPALAPAAADSVVLAVTRSGVMFAGSMAGSGRHEVRASLPKEEEQHSHDEPA